MPQSRGRTFSARYGFDDLPAASARPSIHRQRMHAKCSGCVVCGDGSFAFCRDIGAGGGVIAGTKENSMLKCRFGPTRKRAIAFMVAAAAVLVIAAPAHAPAQPVWNGSGWREAHPDPMTNSRRCIGPHAQCADECRHMNQYDGFFCFSKCMNKQGCPAYTRDAR